MTDKLLPCPFCGGGAEFSVGKTGDGKDWHYIECVDCGSLGPNVNYADHGIRLKEALADAWNQRHSTAPAQHVAVKPLEWRTLDNGTAWSRPTPVGLMYHATEYGWQYRNGNLNQTDGIDAAKTAAQLDYKERVLAAIAATEDKNDG